MNVVWVKDPFFLQLPPKNVWNLFIIILFAAVIRLDAAVILF